jgi:tryptophan-rich sensory protein
MWSTLYTLLAVILYRLLTQPKQNPAVITAIALFAVGIALNWAWIPTAQTEHWDESLAIIVAMLIVAFPTLMSLQTVDKTSALLFAPYLAWLVYATYLNARTTELKRKSA